MIPQIILMIEDDSDREFMEQFYNEYKNLMYFTAGKYIDDSHIVDEIVHDVIARIIMNIKKICARPCSHKGIINQSKEYKGEKYDV